MGPLDASVFMEIVNNSPLVSKYKQTFDPMSAADILAQKLSQPAIHN